VPAVTPGAGGKPALVGPQSFDDQRDHEIGGFSRGNAVVGGQSSVRQVSDQRRNGVGHQPWRGGHHLVALLGGDDESLEVVDEPLVDAAELLVEPVVQRVGVAAMISSRRRDLS
jgi:hypothetical protein